MQRLTRRRLLLLYDVCEQRRIVVERLLQQFPNDIFRLLCVLLVTTEKFIIQEAQSLHCCRDEENPAHLADGLENASNPEAAVFMASKPLNAFQKIEAIPNVLKPAH